jgi:hypothetical protein
MCRIAIARSDRTTTSSSSCNELFNSFMSHLDVAAPSSYRANVANARPGGARGGRQCGASWRRPQVNKSSLGACRLVTQTTQAALKQWVFPQSYASVWDVARNELCALRPTADPSKMHPSFCKPCHWNSIRFVRL